ncbi:hypothetical protein Cgig2_003187 [Carnegiea gigantea]|uniref:Homeobox domain-containing protein n=1 Tax=Carnegiea gigantea TaxID=171969 RepID=A0A9Q1GVJ6_9CARY|nr:hypothetical protein Cgig2_003187 [Carnegiea gigantea]
MGSSSSMKVHPFARGFWDHHHHHHHHHHQQTAHEPSTTTTSTTLSLGCKRLRPLAPKLASINDTVHGSSNATFDLKSFIRPESGPRKPVSSYNLQKKDPTPNQVETHPGGTRWNPTQEQIGILEMLYRGGMRTPNAQQIEQITEQLAKYGKIEGKNVFYWFQNHKARERQKQKRSILGLSHSPRTPSPATTGNTSITLTLDNRVETDIREEESPYKKCRSWTFEWREDKTFRDDGDKTLELFPLRPEGR